jgi:hypothetical protein
MKKRKAPKAHTVPALVVTRSAIETKKLVYVLVANKQVSYPQGKSSIIYIGTTKEGLRRVAASAAYKALSVLKHKGIKTLSAYILTYKGIPGLKDTHKHLERAALAIFKLKYGDIPLANKQGGNIWHAHKSVNFFGQRTLLKKLQRFEELNAAE